MTKLPTMRGRNRDGASADADRATAVEPVPVSPLRDGIPSAVELVWRRDTVTGIAERFAKQYSHYSVAPWKQNEPIESIVAKLHALDTATCDYQAIINAIGSDWTALACDVCNVEHNDVIARIGSPPEYESRWQDICLPCLEKLGAWAAQAIEARRAEEVEKRP